MLVGIVLSIPFLIFSLYTVFTIYIDEHGYMSPSSAFIKIHSNRNNNTSPALTIEDVLNESNAVMKEKPDLILRIPGIFNKAFGLRTPRALNFDLSQHIAQIKETIKNLLENETSHVASKPDLIFTIVRTNTTGNTTSSNNETKFSLNETQNSKLAKIFHLKKSLLPSLLLSEPQISELNSTTITGSLISILNSTTQESLTSVIISTTPESLTTEINSTTAESLTSVLNSTTPESLTSVLNSTTPESLTSVINSTTAESLTSVLNSSTPESLTSVPNLTTPGSLSSLSPATTTGVPETNDTNQSFLPSSVTDLLSYLVDLSTLPVRSLVSLIKYIETKVTGSKDTEDIDEEFLERQNMLPERIENRPYSDISRHDTRSTKPSKFTLIEIERKYSLNISDDKHLYTPDNPLVEIIDVFGLNKSEARHEVSPENLSRYSSALPLEAAEPEDSGYSLYYLWQLPSDYLTGILGMLYSCALPVNTTTTFYSIKDCPTCSSGSQDSLLYITCEGSYVPTYYENIVCHMGEWVVGKLKKPVENFPKCKKYMEFSKCPQLTILENPDAKWVGCVQHGYAVDCESSNITWYPGTELEVLCLPNYKASFALSSERREEKAPKGSTSTLCGSSGEWSRNNVSCKPVCGVLGKQTVATPLVMHGSHAPSGYLPWVAALFLKIGSSLEYICSASIIDNRSVLTAAHCVYTREPSELFVQVGSNELKNNETLLMKVSEIKIPFSYTDKSGNYGSDIAMVLMNSTFEFNDLVQPICVDWDDKLDFGKKALGKVSGWGLDEKFKEVSNLKYVDLPLVTEEECSLATPVGFKKFLGYTKFCAGYKNGTGVCNGDSGAGFMLEHEGQWYLAGTVSISPRQLNSEYCQPDSYALYTKTKLFIPWMKSVLENSDQISTPDNPDSNL